MDSNRPENVRRVQPQRQERQAMQGEVSITITKVPTAHRRQRRRRRLGLPPGAETVPTPQPTGQQMGHHRTADHEQVRRLLCKV